MPIHCNRALKKIRMNKKITAQNAPPAKGPFSHAITNGKLVFTSGQIYLTPEGKLLEGTLEEQIKQIMSNLSAILKAADASFADVVKTTIYITDMSIYSTVNEVYGTYFKEPYPARETVCVKDLPLNAKIEISMVAIKV